ncbi:MAG: DUF1731 domain-containing protein, partial [Candidatus Hydrogenedentes bacterium]|nr:DUF1731 domain-containing protein [Candidatus Hydrogenedentota bacterium]
PRIARWFTLGLGGPLGRGSQYLSWIALEDVVGAVCHALATPALSGPVNVVAPEPATNRAFATALGRVLSRPAVMPAPAFALRLALGEMADGLLLASARAIPRRLTESGYRFAYGDLEHALRHALGRPSR